MRELPWRLENSKLYLVSICGMLPGFIRENGCEDLISGIVAKTQGAKSKPALMPVYQLIVEPFSVLCN